jgi:hypothetical protein
MRTIKTYRKVGAFYIAWEADFTTSIHLSARESTKGTSESTSIRPLTLVRARVLRQRREDAWGTVFVDGNFHWIGNLSSRAKRLNSG